MNPPIEAEVIKLFSKSNVEAMRLHAQWEVIEIFQQTDKESGHYQDG